MSRFFETLKEVSRSQLVPNEPPPNEHADGLGTSGFEKLPPIEEPDLPEIPLIAVGPVSVPAGESEVPKVDFSPEELFESIAPQRDTFSPTAVKVSLDRNEPLLPHTSDSAIIERYRRLRTKIQQQHATKPIHSLMVASPSPGEGKTVTVLNLALSFAMLPSFKVLVIDGDLRKGTVGKWLGLPDRPGLSNLIDGSAGLSDVILKSDNLPFHFMLHGTSKRPATELLTSPGLQASIRKMNLYYDLVLVDSPPVNLVADAQMLAGSCDGVLLVARAFNTSNKAFEKALQDLQPNRIVGTILNGGMRGERYHHYYK